MRKTDVFGRNKSKDFIVEINHVIYGFHHSKKDKKLYIVVRKF